VVDEELRLIFGVVIRGLMDLELIDGAVELTGKSRSRVCDTCLTVEAAGSVLASVPPQEIFSNGAPRASSAIVITVT